MSLRTRLLLLIVGMVALAVVGLTALHFNGLATVLLNGASERTDIAAKQVKNFLIERITSQTRLRDPRPADLDEMKAVWTSIASTDPELARYLESTMLQYRPVAEINVADFSRHIVASSIPARRQEPMERHSPLSALSSLGPADRLVHVLTETGDYELMIPIGIPQQQAPVLEIQLLVSPALIRETLVPQMRATAILSTLALLGSVLIAFLAANLALRPLQEISQALDVIASGKAPAPAAHADAAQREFAAVQSKLSLLGQQVRGAQQMLERLEEAVLLFDAEGRLVVASQSVERLLGISRAELFAQDLRPLLPLQPLRDHPVEWHGKRLLLNFEPLQGGWLGTLRDFESRREIQSQLDIATRLAAITSLTKGVAHEIKNPLNSIALRLELLRMKIEGDLPAASDDVEIIAQEVGRLDRVVKTFLDFTRPVELTREPLDLASILRETVSFIEPETGRSHVIVDLKAPDSAMIRGDKDLLKQAVLNVVMNAVEVMPAGGLLTLTLTFAAGLWELEISDTGPGIPEENRAKLFQLYFTTKPKGSGIGLAMAFRAVHLHSGTIAFSSETGRGATFRLSFPAIDPAPEKATEGKTTQGKTA